MLICPESYPKIRAWAPILPLHPQVTPYSGCLTAPLQNTHPSKKLISGLANTLIVARLSYQCASIKEGFKEYLSFLCNWGNIKGYFRWVSLQYRTKCSAVFFMAKGMPKFCFNEWPWQKCKEHHEKERMVVIFVWKWKEARNNWKKSCLTSCVMFSNPLEKCPTSAPHWRKLAIKKKTTRTLSHTHTK